MRGAKCCHDYGLLSVSLCLSHNTKNYTAELHQIFCACCLWLWLGPVLAAMWYVVYFWFCGWYHVLIWWCFGTSCVFLSGNISGKLNTSDSKFCSTVMTNKHSISVAHRGEVCYQQLPRHITTIATLLWFEGISEMIGSKWILDHGRSNLIPLWLLFIFNLYLTSTVVSCRHN